MDAVKFVKEYLRMCSKFSCCEECPAFMTDFCTVNVEEQSPESAEKIAALVEEWSAAHPRKTRQDLFLEQWPTALMDPIAEDGLLYACPTLFSSEYRDKNGCCAKPNRPCAECRREFWMQEVE